MIIYQEILARLEAGEAVALETRFKGEAGVMAQDMTRALVPVAPEADLKGRLCAKVTLREADDTLIVTEPMLPQERQPLHRSRLPRWTICRRTFRKTTFRSNSKKTFGTIRRFFVSL